MKFFLKLECQWCKHERSQPHSINLDQDDISFVCEQCGRNSLHDVRSITIGERLLYFRSAYEYEETKDYSLSIVFSAAAFECQLFSMFKIRQRIKSIVSEQLYSENDVERIFRTYSNILQKMNEASKLMVLKNFDEFVSLSDELKGVVSDGFPSLNPKSLAKSICEHLFWPRNRILHTGAVYGKDNAKRAFNIAGFGLNVLDEMDRVKFAPIGGSSKV